MAKSVLENRTSNDFILLYFLRILIGSKPLIIGKSVWLLRASRSIGCRWYLIIVSNVRRYIMGMLKWNRNLNSAMCLCKKEPFSVPSTRWHVCELYCWTFGRKKKKKNVPIDENRWTFWVHQKRSGIIIRHNYTSDKTIDAFSCYNLMLSVFERVPSVS